MLVTPGTHNREVWNHHGDDGCFAGLIDPDLIKNEIERAVPCMGKAGSMSFHHVRALHGSAMNTSNRPRNLLLYEVAASDAWPLMGVKDFDEFNSRLLSGDPVIAPRMTDVPVRLPLPPRQAAGLDLRNPVRSEEILLHPRGLSLATAPVQTPARSSFDDQPKNDKKS